MLDEPVGQIEACCEIDFQSELSQFYRDICVESAAIDRVEQSDISHGRPARLIEVMDTFAEDVECGANSALVETGDDPQGIVNSFSRDISIGDSSNNSLRDCR